jgi:hypothetical protein
VEDISEFFGHKKPKPKPRRSKLPSVGKSKYLTKKPVRSPPLGSKREMRGNSEKAKGIMESLAKIKQATIKKH